MRKEAFKLLIITLLLLSLNVVPITTSGIAYKTMGSTSFPTAVNFWLNITATVGGTTSPSPGNYTYAEGTVVSVTAIPNTTAGYSFLYWELDGSRVGLTTGAPNPISVTMNKSYTLNAVFVWFLKITATPGGTTDPEPTDPESRGYAYADGTVVDVYAIPDTGAVFHRWELDREDAGTANPISVRMTEDPFTKTGDHELRAVFLLFLNITVTPTVGGTTEPPPGNYTYIGGTSVAVVAKPFAGYAFDHWRRVDINNTVTINRTKTLTFIIKKSYTTCEANFVWVGAYNLSITATVGGTTSPSPGNYTYTSGTVISVTAMASLGYVFDHWELDGVDAGGLKTIDVIMDADHTLHAVFLWVGTRDLSITATVGGTTSPLPGTYTYTTGKDAFVYAIPDPDYTLASWYLDGNKVGVTNPYKVSMDTDHTLHADFSKGADFVKVFVDLPDQTGNVTDTIVVTVMVSNLTDKKVPDPDWGLYEIPLGNLLSLTFNFTWDPAILEYVSHTVTIPVETYSDGILHEPAFIWYDVLDPIRGFYYAEITGGLGSTPFNNPNATNKIFNMTFNAIGYGSTELRLYPTLKFVLTDHEGTKISTNMNGDPIYLGIEDGYFRTKGPGDVDGDGYVGSADLSVLAGAYGSSVGDSAYDREADFDLDGYIGSADFSTLAGNYGKTFS